MGHEGEGEVTIVAVFYFLLCIDGLLNGCQFRSVRNYILSVFCVKDIFVVRILTSIFRSCDKYDSHVMIAREERSVPIT